MYLWTGDNGAERKRQSIYDVLARGQVERVRGPEPVRWGRLIGILMALGAAVLAYGGIEYWVGIISTWIAGRP